MELNPFVSRARDSKGPAKTMRAGSRLISPYRSITVLVLLDCVGTTMATSALAALLELPPQDVPRAMVVALAIWCVKAGLWTLATVRRAQPTVKVIRRLDAGEEVSADELLLAADRAYLAPRDYSLITFALWTLASSVSAWWFYGRNVRHVEGIAPGVTMVVVSMAIGVPTITFTITSLMGLGISGRLSTLLRDRNIPSVTRRTSIQRRLIVLSLAFGLMPPLWLEGFAYVDHVRLSAYLQMPESERPSLAHRNAFSDLLSAMSSPLLFAVMFVYLTARSIVRPVTLVASTLEGIALKGTAVGAERVPIPHRDEVGDLVEKANLMIDRLESASQELEVKRRLEQELELGARLQTSILPRAVHISRLEIATHMIPATEVGGDYFDLLPFEGGAWIGIGDVAGHGVTAGIVMMMVQGVVASLCRAMPEASPAKILAIANAVLYENIRTRLGNDEHVTFSLLRYVDNGKIRIAGGHEDILVWRARTKTCEIVSTKGPWLAVAKDVSSALVESALDLEPGDLALLYTDGIIEARAPGRVFYGLERLIELLERSGHEPVDVVRDRIMADVAAFTDRRDDDQTIVLLRFTPTGLVSAGSRPTLLS